MGRYETPQELMKNMSDYNHTVSVACNAKAVDFIWSEALERKTLCWVQAPA
jgi:hypothetical protein